MTQKITGEAPFQVLATNFSISPSLQNYILQISADGINYSDLFTVSAGQTKMVTNVANGSFYRMKNNNSEVTINWRTQCNDGQGGGGGSYILPPATQQTLGGVKVGSGLTVQADGTLSANGGGSVDNTILKSVSEFPESAETGDVVALAEHTEGLPYGITFNEMDYNGGDIQGRRLIVPFGSLDELGEGELVFIGNVGPVGGSVYELNISNVGEGVYAFTYEDPNDPLLSIYTNDGDYTESQNGVVFEFYISGNTYVIDIYPDTNETNEIVFTEVPEDSDVVGVYQYDGSAWNKIEGGSEAYRIELSTNTPDDFTEDDIYNLNIFFDAVEEDPSIKDSAYVDINGEFYRCSWAEYDSGIGFGNFSFALALPGWSGVIELHFEDGSYSEGYYREWGGNCLYPNSEFPADPIEGQIANYDDGEGNIGLYQYNGEDWVPYGGGDNTILKAVSGAPATLEKGDVYALNAPFEAPEAPDGQTVYGGNITDFMAAVEDNTQIWVNKWDDAQHTETTNQGYFELDKNGDITYYDYQGDKLFFAFDFPQGEWSDANGVWFRWEGENLYFCVDQESNGVYFNPDVDMDFDSVGSTLGVYQANFKALPNVLIEVDGDAHIDGTAEAPEQVVTNSNGHMLVSFNSPSAATGKVCELESYGDYFPLHYDYSNDRWTLYSTDGETALVEVSDGQSRSDDFGDGNVYLSYSGGVLNAYTDYDKGWKNWEMGDGGTVLDPEELAKVTDLPAENRLVPVPQNYDYGRYLWTDGNSTSWNNAPSPEQYWGYPYDEGQAPVYSNWSVGWHRVVRSEDVLHIVKISVSDYETLVQNQQTDPNTLYLTYEPQV